MQLFTCVYEHTVYAITSKATSAATTLQPVQLQIEGTNKENQVLIIPTGSDFAALASTEHPVTIGRLMHML